MLPSARVGFLVMLLATTSFAEAREEYDRAAALFVQSDGALSQDAIAIRLQRAAMEAEATVDVMMQTIHAHPTLYEAVGEAFNAVYGLSINA